MQWILLDRLIKELLRLLEVAGTYPVVEASPTLQRQVACAAFGRGTAGSNLCGRAVHLHEQGPCGLRRDLAYLLRQGSMRKRKPM